MDKRRLQPLHNVFLLPACITIQLCLRPIGKVQDSMLGCTYPVAVSKPAMIRVYAEQPCCASAAQDDYGRSYPGNPAEKQGMQHVHCWNNTAPIVVKIGDSCPCYQRKGNTVGRQRRSLL